MPIDLFTYASLYAEFYIDIEQSPIGKATCFCVAKNGNYFLLTNWHVVTGRNADTNHAIRDDGFCDPEFMKVWFLGAIPETWVVRSFSLKNEQGLKRWKEHPMGR